jgi:hypothetical protein
MPEEPAFRSYAAEKPDSSAKIHRRNEHAPCKYLERATRIESVYLNSKVLQGKGVAPSPVFNWSQMESDGKEAVMDTRPIRLPE